MRGAGALVAVATLAGCAGAWASSPRGEPAVAAPALAPGAWAVGREDWVARTLARLSLEERAAQVVVPWIGGHYAARSSDDMQRLRRWVERGIGGVVVSVGLPHSVAAKLNALQEWAKVPLLVFADLESGPGMRLAGVWSLPHLLPQGGGTSFPPVMALGAIGDPAIAEAVGRVVAREGRAVGIHATLAPVLDVNVEPANPIVNVRSFGEDPAAVAQLGVAFLRGVQTEGMLAVPKHFPGHGDTRVDSHLDLPTLPFDSARLAAVELLPFQAAVAAGVAGVLVGHLALTGVEGAEAPPASLSPRVIGWLRRGWGFDGLIVTDALAMGAVVRRYGPGEAAVRALEAGADVLLQPDDVDATIDAVAAAVRSGRLPAARLDEAVGRILRAKQRVGLDRRRLVPLDEVDRRVGLPEHQALARRVAERSLVLLRDSAGLLLLPAGARVTLLVMADPADLIAGRALERALRAAGRAVRVARWPEGAAPVAFGGLEAVLDSADRIVVALHVSPREYRGSVDIADEVAAWLDAQARRGRPLILVAFGSPYAVTAVPHAPAALLAWGGGEVSQEAAAEALLGRLAPTGRLPMRVPPYPRGWRAPVRPRTPP